MSKRRQVSKKSKRRLNMDVYVALVQQTNTQGEKRIVFGPISDKIWDFRMHNFIRRADAIHQGDKPVQWSRRVNANLMTDHENYFFFVNDSDVDGVIRTFGFARIYKSKVSERDQRVPWLDIKRWQTMVKPEINEFWNIEQITEDFDGIF